MQVCVIPVFYTTNTNFFLIVATNIHYVYSAVTRTQWKFTLCVKLWQKNHI